jgi:hypothetical protein
MDAVGSRGQFDRSVVREIRSLRQRPGGGGACPWLACQRCDFIYFILFLKFFMPTNKNVLRIEECRHR